MSQNDDRKIVLVTHEMTNTGAPILLRKIAADLKGSGYYVVIISLRSSEVSDAFEKSCNELIVVDKIYSISGKVLKKLGRDVYKRQADALAKTIKALAKRGFDKAIINTMVCGNTVKPFKEHGFKTVTLVHEMKAVYELFPGENRIEYISEYSDHIVFPAGIVKDEFLEKSGGVNGEVHIRPQGVFKKKNIVADKDKSRRAVAEWLGLPSDSEFAVGSGTVAYIKGPDMMLLFAKKLEKRKNLHFVWLGELPGDYYSTHLLAQLKRMGLEKKVHFPGFVASEDLYISIMNGSECFILPSREDSYPSVMAEAISAGLPVIAYENSGGANDLLADGRGQLVPYMDVDLFVQAIVNVLDKKTDVEGEISLAREYVDKHLVFTDYVNELLSYFETSAERKS